MAHDGQHDLMVSIPILENVLGLVRETIKPLETLNQKAIDRLRDLVTIEGKISSSMMETHQSAAHGVAWLATYTESISQMVKWAENLSLEKKFGQAEQLLLQIGVGEYLGQIIGGIMMSQGEIFRLNDIGLSTLDLSDFQTKAVRELLSKGNSQEARTLLVDIMQEYSANITVGDSGLDEDLEMIREQFRKFSFDRIEPHAHEWHLKDELIPLEVISELSDLGRSLGLKFGCTPFYIDAVGELNEYVDFYIHKHKFIPNKNISLVSKVLSKATKKVEVVDKNIKKELKNIALKAFYKHGCQTWGRVDFVYDGKDLGVLEINTVPGFTEKSLFPLAAKHDGIPYQDLISTIIRGI